MLPIPNDLLLANAKFYTQVLALDAGPSLYPSQAIGWVIGSGRTGTVVPGQAIALGFQ